MKSTTTPATEDDDPDKGLLFAWSSSKTVVAHFGIFVAVSAGIHFFGFYLFQVVYPVTARVEPVPSRVHLLDPSQPAVSALMRQIDDRLVFLRPASSGTDIRVDLADHSVQFRPSFSGGKLEFLRVPLAEPVTDGNDGLGIILPPVERMPMPEMTLKRWRVGGGLVDRPVRRPESLEQALSPFFNAMKTGESSIRLNLAVDRQGNVRLVQLPDPELEEDPRFQTLETAVLSHLRFEALSGTPPTGTEETLQRGWLEIGGR